MAEDPHGPAERRAAARRLLQHPLTCAEHDADLFRLIRRHAAELDRWFTQRLGYRLHVDSDTARLFKTGFVPEDRPLRTRSERPFHQGEYILLALVLSATAAGPAVISLRDLVDAVRSAAAEAEVTLTGEDSERRALVSVLRWMIDHGLAREMHSRVEGYATDETADAVLKIRPDRIALLCLPTLVGADDGADLLGRADRRASTRQWLRLRLVEDPVTYRHDLTDPEWFELRRRLSEEARMLEEMFGLVVEARAEGVAAVDPSGNLSSRRFPGTDTVGHAALLLFEHLRPSEGRPPAHARDEIVSHLAQLTATHRSWKKDLVANPERLADHVIRLLVQLRLARLVPATQDEDRLQIELLPAAARFLAVETEAVPASQAELW